MPIFHLAAKTISRGAGRSAVAAAAYRSGTRLWCERTGLVYDSTRRHGVVATRIVVPQSETAIGRELLWNKAEAAERRCNSTLAREVEIALPHELGEAAREKLAIAFAERLAARYQIAIDVAIHEPSGRGDDRNWHAHLLTTTRVMEDDGSFGRKVRVLDDRRTGPTEVTAIRSLWAEMCNEALAAAGIDEAVDHRSHAERGLDRAPGRKLGIAATGFEARTGKQSRRRTDHDEAREAVPAVAAMADRLAAERKPDPGVGRAEAFRAVLRQLQTTFDDATTAVLAGRPSPTIDAAFALVGGGAGIVQTPSRPAAGERTRAVSPIAVLFSAGPSRRTATPVVASQPKAAVRHRRPYDEEAEAAEMHRRVEHELAAELMGHLTQDRTETEKAAKLSERRSRLGISTPGGWRPRVSLPVVTTARPRGAVSAVGACATVPAKRGDDDHLRDRNGESEDVMTPVEPNPPQPAEGVGSAQYSEELRIALMMARRLIRMNKRSRPRIAQLAEVAGVDVTHFEAIVAAEKGPSINFELMTAHPALDALWTTWAAEERERDKRKPSRQTPATGETMAPDQTAPGPAAEHAPSRPAVEDAAIPARGPESSPPSAQPPIWPASKKDVVVAYAILVIAHKTWTPALGDALADQLGTRRNWIWEEAHRVARKQFGKTAPNQLSMEVRKETRANARNAAKHFPGLLKDLETIYAGKIPREHGR